MNTKKLVLMGIIFLVCMLPVFAIADAITTDVIIVIKSDKIVAFSGQINTWVSRNLKLKEKVILKKAHGNVGVVVTSERLYGFSALSGQWKIVERFIDEDVRDVQAEGNVATVTTDQRILGFNAHTGLWSEFN